MERGGVGAPETLLDETAARDVGVQLTLWDRHDLSADHPWYHENTLNYGRYDSEVARPGDPYGGAERNAAVHPHLERFVDRVLDATPPYDRVLYRVANERTAGEAWERHWAEYVRERRRPARGGGDEHAHVAGRSVVTALRHPETVSHVEVPQANQHAKGYVGRAHWDHLRSWRAEVADAVRPRPFSSVKVYGGTGDGGSSDGGRRGGAPLDPDEAYSAACPPGSGATYRSPPPDDRTGSTASCRPSSDRRVRSAGTTAPRRGATGRVKPPWAHPLP